jgi:hypothetical protein|tara:strand:- start:787 stop:1083 length:297 start_codon:yes stop_codon:yes gene_type:complete
MQAQDKNTGQRGGANKIQVRKARNRAESVADNDTSDSNTGVFSSLATPTAGKRCTHSVSFDISTTRIRTQGTSRFGSIRATFRGGLPTIVKADLIAPL